MPHDPTAPRKRPRARRVLLACAVQMLTVACAVRAQFAPPLDPPGFRPRPPGLHALTGARVIPRPGVVLTNATILVSNGVIQAVGTGIAVPDAARAWDMAGLTVYPGFIEPCLPFHHDARPDTAPGDDAPDSTDSSRHASDPWSGPRFFGAGGAEFDPGRRGPGASSPEVTPELRVATAYTPRARTLSDLRQLGFTAAHVVPARGIIRGTAALVSLADTGPNAAVLRPDTAQCVAFQTGSRGSFPGSLMGVFALVRQTLLDMDHYAAAIAHARARPDSGVRPAYNASLEALQSLRAGQPLLLEAEGVLQIHQALNLADEFKLSRRAIVASGGEWRRPDLLTNSTASLYIVPLDFPALPRFENPDDWDEVSLDQLRAWDWAPELPDLIRRHGHAIALSTRGLDDLKSFRRNLRDAIDRGLPEEDALAALTLHPARWLEVEDRLGSIEPGRIANLTVVRGDYFDPEAPVRQVWIEGVPHVFDARSGSGRGESSREGTGTAAPESRERARPDALRELRRERTAHPPLHLRGPSASPRMLVITNATLWTCGPEGVLTRASLMVADGRIAAVLPSAPSGIDPDAMILDGTGLHITPGLIDCHSHSMILGGVNEATIPSSAMVRVADVINSESPTIRQQLAGGLTVANLLHGSANPIGGQNAVIKLRDGAAPRDLLFASAPPGIKFALGENVKQSNRAERSSRFPQSRMGVASFFVNRFTAAQAYRVAHAAAAADPRNTPPPRRDLELEALAEILDGTRLIHCHSYRQDEILAFLRVMESFGVRVATLQHILEGYKVADEIARHGAGASAFSDWWAYKVEVFDAIPYAGSLMRERGVTVSFNSDSSDLARRLNTEAAKAVKYGRTPPEEALRFVTLNPARQLGIDRRVGSLEPGKDADFVVWSGDPLDSTSVCLQTWIDGTRYFDRDQEAERARSLAAERDALLAKARRFSGRGGDSNASEEARRRFFERALEQAAHLGVVHCEDCP